MTLAPDVLLAYALVTLDTAPPRLTLTAEGVVQPPDPLVVTVRSSEPIGVVRLTFTDAFDTLYPVGYVREDAYTLTATLPTVGMTTGGGILHVEVTDQVCNLALLDWPVYIDRPRAYDVVVSTDAVLGLALREGTMFEIFTEHLRAYAVRLLTGLLHEITVGHEDAFDVETATEENATDG